MIFMKLNGRMGGPRTDKDLKEGDLLVIPKKSILFTKVGNRVEPSLISKAIPFGYGYSDA